MFKLLANTLRDSAVPCEVTPCNTIISPDDESATNTSPFGETVSHRGRAKSLANTETLNPGGTLGRKFAGDTTITGSLSTRTILEKIRARHPPMLRTTKSETATQ